MGYIVEKEQDYKGAARMPGFTATKTIPQLVNNPLILRLVMLKVQ